jgi:hypothetical protein
VKLPRPFAIAGLLLLTGLLVGCDRPPPRMKNQPTGRDSGETRIELPGKKKPLTGGR